MALKTFVKISGVNNLSDARYCAGMGVDMIGFSLDPDDEKFVSPESFKEITGWLSGVKFVGEFNKSDAATIEANFSKYSLNYLQIVDPSFIRYLQSFDAPPLLLRLTTRDLAENPALFEKYARDIEYFLIEADAEGFDKEKLASVLKLSQEYPILLGFGINENNVHELLQNSSLKGIALRGGEEIKPGLKDFDELADILEALEIDDL